MKREETIDFHIKSAWHAISRMYNQQAAKFGGTMSIGYVLLNIDSTEGTPATKIAPLLGLEPRSLTRILKNLEEEGMVVRKKDPLDGRSVRIFLTARGRAMREFSRETVLTFNNAVRERIPEEKLQICFEVIQEVNRMLEQDEIFNPIHTPN